MNSSQNHINVMFFDRVVPKWQLTCFYGFPERSRRSESWDFLRQLAQNMVGPWFIFSDFNDLLHDADKQGPHPHPGNLMEGVPDGYY